LADVRLDRDQVSACSEPCELADAMLYLATLAPA
jgi:hypothetical protein